MMKPQRRSKPMHVPVDRPAPDSIIRLVADYTGFDLSSSTVRERARSKIGKHLTRNGVSCPEGYAEKLRGGGSELSALVDALSIRETYFFRENKALDRIRYELLPELIVGRPADRPILVWSAGCASGEEPYSLAIIMYEAGLADRARIIATDVSQQALKQARRARYRRWSLRDTDDEALRRYFHLDGTDQVLNYAIRRIVSIEHHNLASGLPPTALATGEKADLILLRNVLIYFTPEVIDRVAKTVFDSLATDGWLITGACDPSLERSGLFERISDGSLSIYRPRSAALTPTQLLQPVPSIAPLQQSQIDPALSAPVAASRPLKTPAPPPRSDLRADTETTAAAEHPSLAEAERALAAGDYARAMTIAAWFSDDPHACVLCITALANTQGTAAALRQCRQACCDHPLSAELHFLDAVMSIDEGHDREALGSLRRTLYLDNSLAIAHFSLALVLERSGDSPAAQHSLRNAANLCSELKRQDELPLAGGQSAGALADEIAALLDDFANAQEGTR